MRQVAAPGWRLDLVARHSARKLRADQPFELHTYLNVEHGFDTPRLDRLVLNQGHALLYDQAAAEDSCRWVRGFLARWMMVPNAGN
jgi:dienelactone hydrolase